MSTILCFSVNMGCCVYINEEKKWTQMILANGCNITKSEKFKGVWILSVPTVYTLTKIIYATLLFLPPLFMSWTQRSKTFSMYTKGLFLSNIVHKYVQICVSEHFSFADIMHPPHKCGISRCWLDNMIITQACLRLATIKGHSKMCSFITQHNATDVASFEGACNWHANCRNAHQSCCPWIEC